MKPAEIFKRVRVQVIILLIALGVAGAGTFAAWQYEQKTERQLRQSEQEARQLEAAVRQMRNDEPRLREEITLFQSLQSRGLIGVERRLDWVELIHAVQVERKLYDIDYEFMPQVRLQAGQFPQLPSGHDVYVSPMRFTMPLLHEGDLTGFISDLTQRASAWVRARDCQIRRIPVAAQAGLSAELEATCQLDWITLRNKSEGNPS